MLSLKTLPNFLTLLRIVFTFLIIFLLLSIRMETPNTGKMLIVLILFSLAAIFDYIDGLLARKLHAETAFGKALDPIADKVLVAGSLLSLISLSDFYSLTPILLPAILIILRDFVIAGFREFLALESYRLKVSVLAKWKTTVEMIALSLLFFSLFLQSTSLPNLAGETTYMVKIAGYGFLWFAALLSLVTAGHYILQTWQFLKK